MTCIIHFGDLLIFSVSLAAFIETHRMILVKVYY